MSINMSDADNSTPVNTYHCICTTLVLVTTSDLKTLTTRTETTDGALMLPLRSETLDLGASAPPTLRNVVVDKKSVVIKRSDGFEKRFLLKCHRCDLVVGYKLDGAHFERGALEADRFVYILPGGLVSTSDMKAARMPDALVWT